MGFSGGGSNVTKPHTHDSTIVQDGGSLAANVTQFGLSAGSLLYSDGSNIQELGVGSAADTLVVNGAATAPEWTTTAAAGAWSKLGFVSNNSYVSSLSVTSLAEKDFLAIYYRIQNEDNNTQPWMRWNGITSSTYSCRKMKGNTEVTETLQAGLTIGQDVGNAIHYAMGVAYIIKPNPNLLNGGTFCFWTGTNFDAETSVYTPSNLFIGGGTQPQTAAIDQIDMLYDAGDVKGQIQVMGFDFD